MAGLRQPAVLVEAAGEEREARRAKRAIEVVVRPLADRHGAREPHAHGVVRDQQRPPNRAAFGDQPPVPRGVDALRAECVDR